ncbi:MULTISPECIES: hypothetical protein [Halorussus]|uniref:Uncharacterized protein n=2 Tax=Halorussus TaxID=1070314 RepID=A0A8U0HV31_9EURY|nr:MULTISPECIES: hypothetical protein [Halorussus]UPV74583.1 hypothetical protein M0R89_00595 [Halorussus limi]
MSTQDETSNETHSIETISIRNRGRTELDRWLPSVESEFTVTDVIRLVDDYSDILMLKTEMGINVLVDHHIEGIDIDNPDADRLVGETFKHVEESNPPKFADYHHLVKVGEDPERVVPEEERHILTL